MINNANRLLDTILVIYNTRKRNILHLLIIPLKNLHFIIHKQSFVLKIKKGELSLTFSLQFIFWETRTEDLWFSYCKARSFV